MATPHIPESFLAQLRAALPVSRVIGADMKLIKRGHEFVAAEDSSFTINDQKGFFYDFGSGRNGKQGDIIEWTMSQHHCTFQDAVERLAQMAGMSLPDGGKGKHKHRNGAGANGSHGAPSQQEAPPVDAYADQVAAAGIPTREPQRITGTWSYTDPDGGELYQEVKLEWQDGENRRKVVLPRRRIPGVPGWVWGLKAGIYVQDRAGDWRMLTEKRKHWSGKRQEFDEQAPTLYRLPELREEMAQSEDERRAAFVPEGCKDADTLVAWGLVATTCSQGSNGWQPHFAQEFAGADVVIPIDNDAAGRKLGYAKAASLRDIARSVKLLDWREHWKFCPEGGDVTDWRDQAGGTKEKLFAILDKLPEWTPTPPESSFHAVRFVDLDKPARELEWLVKHIMTRNEVSIWFGMPSCGKSFLITDCAMAIARGVSWMGARTRSGLVVYQAGEGGLGLKKRLRAYRRYYQIPASENVPFVLLPSRVDLFSADDHTNKLIEEIRAWAAFYDAPLELVVIDTFSAASPGANENASEDVSRVLQRCHRIANETGAHVALVHHTPKLGGSPRGHSSLLGNVENAVEVIRTEDVDSEEAVGGKLQRDIREFIVRKQKDGADGLTRRFVLKKVTLGTDIDGEPDDSCVVHEITTAGTARTQTKFVPSGYVELSPNNQVIMRALVHALKAKGQVAPDKLNAPHGERVCRIGDWIEAMCAIRTMHDPADPDGKKLFQRCKKAIERAVAEYDWCGKRNLVGKDGAFVWRTHRRVHGIDDPPAYGGRPITMPPEQESLLAPGGIAR